MTTTSTATDPAGQPQQGPFCEGLDCLLQIFKHLHGVDLCRARRVSRFWRHAASHPMLWRICSFRGIGVAGWPDVIELAQQMGSATLDFSAVGDPAGIGQLAHGPGGERLRALSAVRELRLPDHTTTSGLDAITQHLPGLTQLIVGSLAGAAHTAGSAADNAVAAEQGVLVDFRHICKMQGLQVLQLRGAGWLLVPAFSFTGGIANLDMLANLRVLEITTFRKVSAADFSFLPELQQLRVLSVGDCLLWDAGVYDGLAELAGLTHLRLEVGGGDEMMRPLGRSLQHMARLRRLDLIHFDVTAELGECFEALPALETLSIQPMSTLPPTPIASINMACCEAVARGTSIKDLRLLFGQLDPIPFGAAGRSISLGTLEERMRGLMPNSNVRVLHQFDPLGGRGNFMDDAMAATETGV